MNIELKRLSKLLACAAVVIQFAPIEAVLALQVADLRTSYDKSRAEEIERQANELNSEVSKAMKNTPAPAAPAPAVRPSM